MDEIFDIYTLIFLVAAVVIFIRLRSVLGSKTGNERRWEQMTPRERAEATDRADGAEARADNVIPMPGSKSDEYGATAMMRSDEDLEEVLDKHAPGGSPLRERLLKIIRQDPEFDPDAFIHGAKTAYEMIVTSFAEGNRKLLKQLLSNDVFEGFLRAIKEREARGETIDSSFVGIDKAEIIDAEMRDKTAHITVKFVSSLITATLNSAGEVIDGDPKKVRKVTDIWTFARKLPSRDPNWKLVATEGAG